MKVFNFYLKQVQFANFGHENFNPFTTRKVCKQGVFAGPYFPVFSPNTGKYGAEKTPCLDTFHAVFLIMIS